MFDNDLISLEYFEEIKDYSPKFQFQETYQYIKKYLEKKIKEIKIS